jgi:FtsP/CotA-like multicopper oxidase with cupredoxin domain
MAMPGQTLHYVVNIPLDQPPGLYWYHTHPHGESYQQDLDGMS